MRALRCAVCVEGPRHFQTENLASKKQTDLAALHFLLLLAISVGNSEKKPIYPKNIPNLEQFTPGVEEMH